MTTGAVVALCFGIRRALPTASRSGWPQLDRECSRTCRASITPARRAARPEASRPRCSWSARYGGLGIHTLLAILALLPKPTSRTSSSSRWASSTRAPSRAPRRSRRCSDQTDEDLEKYVELARRLGFAAGLGLGRRHRGRRRGLGASAARSPSSTRASFFAGKLIFQRERWYQRLLHNETAIPSSAASSGRAADGRPADPRAGLRRIFIQSSHALHTRAPRSSGMQPNQTRSQECRASESWSPCSR